MNLEFSKKEGRKCIKECDTVYKYFNGENRLLSFQITVAQFSREVE